MSGHAFHRRDVRQRQRVFASRNSRFGLAAMEFRLKVDYENIRVRKVDYENIKLRFT
jgi:hypothetical protein